MKVKKRYKNGPCILKVEAGTNRLLYHYKAGETEFEFDLFSEVGQPYQRYYLELFETHNIQRETVECEGWPHVYDRVLGVTSCG